MSGARATPIRVLKLFQYSPPVGMHRIRLQTFQRDRLIGGIALMGAKAGHVPSYHPQSALLSSASGNVSGLSIHVLPPAISPNGFACGITGLSTICPASSRPLLNWAPEVHRKATDGRDSIGVGTRRTQPGLSGQLLALAASRKVYNLRRFV
jgi:hypothetical protein